MLKKETAWISLSLPGFANKPPLQLRLACRSGLAGQSNYGNPFLDRVSCPAMDDPDIRILRVHVCLPIRRSVFRTYYLYLPSVRRSAVIPPVALFFRLVQGRLHQLRGNRTMVSKHGKQASTFSRHRRMAAWQAGIPSWPAVDLYHKQGYMYTAYGMLAAHLCDICPLLFSRTHSH